MKENGWTKAGLVSASHSERTWRVFFFFFSTLQLACSVLAALLLYKPQLWLLCPARDHELQLLIETQGRDEARQQSKHFVKGS